MTPNAELARAVKLAVEPFLGTYADKNTGQVKGKAWWAVQASSALVAEGLPASYTASGLEVIMATYPSPIHRGSYEMTERGMKGAIYHEVVLKGWSAPTSPAFEALLEAFPLMTTRLARPPRFVPGSSEIVETLTAYIPLIN